MKYKNDLISETQSLNYCYVVLCGQKKSIHSADAQIINMTRAIFFCVENIHHLLHKCFRYSKNRGCRKQRSTTTVWINLHLFSEHLRLLHQL